MTASSSSYVLGLDLGPPGEATALAILERTATAIPPDEPEYRVRHLERFPPGTPYPGIVEMVADRANAPELRDSASVVDCTAVGRVVLDRLRRALPKQAVVAVVVGAGHTVQSADGLGLMVPKKDLVSALQMVLQTRRLKVAPELPDAGLLASELASFRLRRVLLGDSIEWREGRHDDLVLAAALTVWYAERFGASGGNYVEGPLLVWPDGETDSWESDEFWD